MPTYYRPRMAHVDPGGPDWGALALIAAGVAAAAAVVAFALAHLILIAAAVAVLAAVPIGTAMVMRRFIEPRGIRRWRREQERGRVAGRARPSRVAGALSDGRVPELRRVVHPPVLELGPAPGVVGAVPKELDPPRAGDIAGPVHGLAVGPGAVVEEDLLRQVVERHGGTGDGAGRGRAGKRRFGHGERMPR